MRNEHALKAKVDKLLKERPYLWFFKVHGGPMQRAGVPDYILCFYGRFLALEIKHPHETPQYSPRQEVEVRGIIAAYGETFITNSLEQIELWLDGLERTFTE